MATIHISEADAARDFAGLMAHVRAGEEIVIEANAYPLAVISAAPPPRRSVTECIELAKRHEKETGKAPVLDGEFISDMEEVLRNRPSSVPPGVGLICPGRSSTRVSSLRKNGEARLSVKFWSKYGSIMGNATLAFLL